MIQAKAQDRDVTNIAGRTGNVQGSGLFPRPLAVVGVDVVPFDSYSQVTHYVQSTISAGRKSFCVAINPEKIHRANQDAELRDVLRQADISICDGTGVVLAAKLLHGRRVKRCTGVDLFFELLAAAASNKWKVFLLGASADSNAEACRVLTRQYPGLEIVGSRDGYFRDSAKVVREINASGADLLFAAMGSPRQELWIGRHRDDIDAAFCMGVGGALDVVSGSSRRAPKLFRKTGTEFVFRLISEPKRWRRQLVLPLFALKVLRQYFAGIVAFNRR